MKKTNCHIFFGIILLVISVKSYSQPGTISLSFSGDNNGQSVALESVWIKNITQNCDTTIYPPELTLLIDTIMTGFHKNSGFVKGFKLSQNYPNPFCDQTSIGLILPEGDQVSIFVTNLAGMKVTEYSGWLSSGLNTFIFVPGSENVYILTATFKNKTMSIRMLTSGSGYNSDCSLFVGSQDHQDSEKSSTVKSYFDFDPGDQLLFAGYASGEESGILDSPAENKDYVFQFATNIPCPGFDSLFYEGKYYHTIQIFSQCWMKENLDAGTMIPGNQSPSNNGVIEKYCYANNSNNCAAKGGLYIWEEMMQYSTNQGAQGICPSGWHLPTDEEWKILEGIADSQYEIGNTIWNNSNSFRGFDAGKNLKSTSGWSANGNGTDIYGFTAISGGYWWQNGFFENANFGIYWTSTLSNQSLPWYRGFRMDMNGVARFTFDGVNGYSVRCLKDQ
jgi:uncharacterized protein (TIGR02145 family)